MTALALLVTAAAAWWLLREPSAPYALRATPEVNVTLRPEESTYPEAKEVADEVELLVKVYVQRLQAGEPADLAHIGAPWYTARERAAQGLISRYGAHAGEPVEAVVSDPVVPGLAAVELRFSTDRDRWWTLSGATMCGGWSWGMVIL